MIRGPSGYNGAGEFVLPSRERLSIGDELRVEVSFGPMADEITVEGVVTSVEERGTDDPPFVTVHIFEPDAPRMNYILAVLKGRRPATARRHRRVPADIDIRWWWGIKAHNQKALGLSLGGTFVRSPDAPGAGFRTEVEIRTDSRLPPLRIPSVVVWSGLTGTQRGFGVAFKVDDSTLAERLRQLVRDCERLAETEVVSLSPR